MDELDPSALLRAALDYAERGFYVFPCHSTNGDGRCTCGRAECDSPGKHPRITDNLRAASIDPAQIEAWWTKWPAANIGVSCGGSALAIPDIDEKDGRGGLATWRALRQELGPQIEDTAIVATPSAGGRHVWYRANGHRIGSKNDLLGAGVDVKAEGGYVLAPPSAVAGVEYHWLEGHALDCLAPLPPALGERLAYATKKPPKPAADPSAERIPKGQRHAALASLAGTMHNKGCSEKEIAAALHVAAAERCDPPYTDAAKIDALARDAATKWTRSGGVVESEPEPPLDPPPIAASPDILADFNLVLHSRGVVGEDRFAKVVYLCLTSRVLDRPVSLAAKGQSSAGKSFILQEVLKFFPDSAYYSMTAMSERVLAYSQEPLSHRFLIVYEAAGMEGDFASYLIRSLLSEGCIRYETMVKKPKVGLVPVLIERQGPTGLITTTTRVHLHPENETRLLSVPANDTQEQTAAVMYMLACENGRCHDEDLDEFHLLQSWIDAQDNRVTIPYAPELADLVPPVAVRLRRDFSTVQNLIKAHAILHQQTRERDAEGRIIATVSDYAVVRALIADLVADEVGATVPPLVVETVQAVAELNLTRPIPGVNYQQLGEHLKIDKSTALSRARAAMGRGYLQNLEDKRGRPARLTTADPLPGEIVILPTASMLSGWAVGRALEGKATK